MGQETGTADLAAGPDTQEVSLELGVEFSAAAKRRIIARSVLLLAGISMVASSNYAEYPFLSAVFGGRWFWRFSQAASAWEALWTASQPGFFYLFRFVLPTVLGTAALLIWPPLYEELATTARASLRRARESGGAYLTRKFRPAGTPSLRRRGRFIFAVIAIFVVILSVVGVWAARSGWRLPAWVSPPGIDRARSAAEDLDLPPMPPRDKASASPPPSAAWGQISVGMTTDQVLATLGQPSDIEYSPGRQIWSYPEELGAYGARDYVWFEEVSVRKWASSETERVLKVTNFKKD